MSTVVTSAATEGQVLTMRSGSPAWDMAATRASALIAAQGLAGEAYPRAVANSSATMISGTIYLMSFGVLSGDVITNIVSCFNTAGAGLTLAKVGLYDKAGTRLAVSNDLSADWVAGTGPHVNALSSPYTVTADGGLYAAMLAIGTTPPTVLRSASLTPISTPVGTGIRPIATGGTAQTDLIASVAPVVGTPFSYWVGWN